MVALSTAVVTVVMLSGSVQTLQSLMYAPLLISSPQGVVVTMCSWDYQAGFKWHASIYSFGTSSERDE